MDFTAKNANPKAGQAKEPFGKAKLAAKGEKGSFPIEPSKEKMGNPPKTMGMRRDWPGGENMAVQLFKVELLCQDLPANHGRALSNFARRKRTIQAKTAILDSKMRPLLAKCAPGRLPASF